LECGGSTPLLQSKTPPGRFRQISRLPPGDTGGSQARFVAGGGQIFSSSATRKINARLKLECNVKRGAVPFGVKGTSFDVDFSFPSSSATRNNTDKISICLLKYSMLH
jgi:hypothetical protein